MSNELLVTEASTEEVKINMEIYEAIDYLSNVIHNISYIIEQERRGGQRNVSVRTYHALIGLRTEVGELWDAFKKHWFYHSELSITNVHEEIGDIIWYKELLEDDLQVTITELDKEVVFVANLLGSSYAECREAVIRKLRVRYPNSFTRYDAENRDTVTEMEAFTDAEFEDLRAIGAKVRED